MKVKILFTILMMRLIGKCNEMSHMPQSNGRNTLVFQGKLTNYVNLSNYRFEVKDMFIERNKSDLIKVVQERPITCYYKAKGNIYVETQYDNVDIVQNIS